MKRSIKGLKRRFFVANLLKYLAVILLSTLLMGVPAIFVVQGQVKRQVEQTTEAVFALSSNSFENLFNIVSEIRTYCDTSPSLLLYLLQLSMNKQAFENKAFYEWQGYINTTLLTRPYLLSVCIVKAGSPFIIANDQLLDKAQFGNEMFFQYLTSFPHDILSYQSLSGFGQMQQDVVSIIAPLKYNLTLSVNISRSYFRTLFNEATQYSGQLFWLESVNDTIVAGNQASESYLGANAKQLKDELENDYYLQRHILNMPLQSLYMCSAIPRSIVMAPALHLGNWLLIVIIIAFFSSLLISLVLTGRSYQKINRILNLFESNELDGQQILGGSKTLDTYTYILEQVAEAYVRESKLKEEITQHNLDLVSSELTALQYQINPHFIFNTLQSIDLAIKAGKDSEASRMIGLFSDLLRYSIQNPNQAVTFLQEEEKSKTYAALAQSRIGGKVRVIWDYDEEKYGSLPILRLLFQPIIENVYQHGMWPDEKTTTLRIRIRARGKWLYISAVDNGPGMDKSSLDALKVHIHTGGPITSHIGLANINRRLLLRYGADSTLSLHSFPGMGLGIFIRIKQKMIPFDNR